MDERAMKLTKEMIQKAMSQKLFAWVDTVMKDILPDSLYQCAHNGNMADRINVNGWLKEKGYRIVSQPDGVVQLYQGTKLLRQAKIALELTDPEELLQIAECVSKNTNIPPPPWK